MMKYDEMFSFLSASSFDYTSGDGQLRKWSHRASFESMTNLKLNQNTSHTDVPPVHTSPSLHTSPQSFSVRGQRVFGFKDEFYLKEIESAMTTLAGCNACCSKVLQFVPLG